MRFLRPFLLLAASFAVPLVACSACNKKAVEKQAETGVTVGGLTPEQAQKPVAKFGDHVITLGEFAQVLADMPEYERLRYQSVDRRKELLKAMVDVILLAEEAKKQGLDKDPKVDEEIRQVLVSWMRGNFLMDLPAPAAIPESEVRAWYTAHIDEYKEPERRRVAQVVVKDEATAKKVSEEAKAAGPTAPAAWGVIVKKYSDEKPGDFEAPELMGDLGFVTAPSDTHPPSSLKITPEIRAAAFAMKDVGDVSPPLKDANGWHVLKMLVRNEAHEQSYADVERAIRVRILQDKRYQREQATLAETKAAVKVEVDETAIAALASSMAAEETPPPAPSGSTSGSASASVSGSTSGSAAPSTKPSASVKKP